MIIFNRYLFYKKGELIVFDNRTKKSSNKYFDNGTLR